MTVTADVSYSDTIITFVVGGVVLHDVAIKLANESVLIELVKFSIFITFENGKDKRKMKSKQS